MGKNQDLESLIRLIVNTIVHEIVAKHTNKPESAGFLNSEIIEYRNQAERVAKTHNWNNEDKLNLEEKALKKIKERLAIKYDDVNYTEEELLEILKRIIEEIM